MTWVQPLTSGTKPSNIIRTGKALAVFLAHVPDVSANVCDIGCGNGAFLKLLSDRGYADLNGVEINDYGNREFNVLQCDLSYEPLPSSDEAFDVLTVWEVFEHLENPYNLIREARRVLKPEGLLIFSMPNIFHIHNRLRFLRRGDFVRWTRKNDHRTYFTNKVFQKSFLRDFNLVERRFCVPSWMQVPIKDAKRERLRILLNRLLPESEWFGYFVVYVLRKKSEQPR